MSAIEKTQSVATVSLTHTVAEEVVCAKGEKAVIPRIALDSRSCLPVTVFANAMLHNVRCFINSVSPGNKTALQTKYLIEA